MIGFSRYTIMLSSSKGNLYSSFLFGCPTFFSCFIVVTKTSNDIWLNVVKVNALVLVLILDQMISAFFPLIKYGLGICKFSFYWIEVHPVYSKKQI